MSKLRDVWIIAETAEAIASLTAAGASFGEKTTLIYSGDRSLAKGADVAYYLGELKNESFINYIPQIIRLVCGEKPAMVLAETSKNGRLAAGAIAAALECCVLSDVSSLGVTDGGVTGVRMVYGGAAFKTEKALSETVVVCAGAGVFPSEDMPPTTDIRDLAATSSGIRLIEKRIKKEKTVNLSAAERVVCAGRGVTSEEVLQSVFDFANVIDAEVGCTRPLAEEMKWMPRDSYLGVSGIMIKPKVYMGLGISGQIQHMVGVNQAGVVFAINKDKNAPIFNLCDYGLVADLTEVLPAIKDKLK